LYNQQGRSKRVDDFQTIQDDEWTIEELAAGWVYIYIYIGTRKSNKVLMKLPIACGWSRWR
jgi:hypothetical protein